MRMYKAENVDAYITNSDIKAQPILKEIRVIIKSTIPNVEKGISWGIPFYKHHGLLAGFSVFKNHVGFGFCDAFQSKDRQALEEKGYTTGKKTVQIMFDQKVPTAEIKKILKAKSKINEAK